MLADLNHSGVVAWALADDIVVGAIGHLQLMAATKKINDHCRRLHLNVNKAKSGIMTIRVDGRQKHTYKGNEIFGYPVVTEYKYLGVMLDDCLNMRANRNYKQLKYDDLKKKEWILKK